MQVTKSQKRLLIVLGIVVAYGIFDISTNLDTYKQVYSGHSKTRVAKNKSKNKTNLASKDMKGGNEPYLAGWGRDPFYVKEHKVVRKKRGHVKHRTIRLRLLAISMKGSNSVALINDKIVKEGDIISGYQVLKISSNKVYLSKGKKRVTLQLKTY